MTQGNIRGEAIFRDMDGSAHGAQPDGTRLLAVIGVIEVDEFTYIETDTRYAVSGEDRAGVSQLDVHMRTGAGDSLETSRMGLQDMLARMTANVRRRQNEDAKSEEGYKIAMDILENMVDIAASKGPGAVTVEHDGQGRYVVHVATPHLRLLKEEKEN